MARSVVGYVNAEGDFRGTFINSGGHPENAIPNIEEKVKNLGYEGFVEWVEEGITKAGFRFFGDVGDIFISEKPRTLPYKAALFVQYAYKVYPCGGIDYLSKEPDKQGRREFSTREKKASRRLWGLGLIKRMA